MAVAPNQKRDRCFLCKQQVESLNRIPQKSNESPSKSFPTSIVVAPHHPYAIPHPHRHVFLPGYSHHRDIIVFCLLLLQFLHKPDKETHKRKCRDAPYHSPGDDSLVQTGIHSV